MFKKLSGLLITAILAVSIPTTVLAAHHHHHRHHRRYHPEVRVRNGVIAGAILGAVIADHDNRSYD